MGDSATVTPIGGSSDGWEGMAHTRIRFVQTKHSHSEEPHNKEMTVYVHWGDAHYDYSNTSLAKEKVSMGESTGHGMSGGESGERRRLLSTHPSMG